MSEQLINILAANKQHNQNLDIFRQDIQDLDKIINQIYPIIEWIYSIYDLINISPTIFSIIYDLFMILPVLIAVAFVTVAERKAMGSMQRRLGPNITGVWGTLQAFADALKLILKENVSPTQANLIFFWFGPVITLVFSLLGFAVIPYRQRLIITKMSCFAGISNFFIYKYMIISLFNRIKSFIFIMWKWNVNSQYVLLYNYKIQFIKIVLILNFFILIFMLINFNIINETFQITFFFLSPLPFMERSITSSLKHSDSLKPINMTDDEFNQWFTGFIDGEGNFSITIVNNSTISFKLSIKLHVDDKNALEYIKYRLNCGNIYFSSNSVIFEVNKIDDIQIKLIPLLDKFPLNGVKFLDYLSLKKAIAIKYDLSISKSEKIKLISELKNNMNTKRVDFTMPTTHTIRITPYYLLGLIEGEGSFCLSKASLWNGSYFFS